MKTSAPAIQLDRQAILINGSFAPSLLNFRGHLLKELASLGYAVHVSAPDISPLIVSKLADMGVIAHDVPIKRTGLGMFQDIKYCLHLILLIRRTQPIAILNYTIKPNIWGGIAAGMTRTKSFSWVTGLGFAFISDHGLKRRTVQFIARSLYRLATGFNEKVIFQNPDDLRDFVAGKCLGDPQKAEIVNGSGVDTRYFQVTPLPNTAVFLLIARLLKSKGIKEYAEAAAHVRKKKPEARFQLAGMLDEGPDAIDQAELDELIASGIEFLGPLDDVRPAISAASVYVLPSWREGTPRTVLEAMAMGRPIITTDAPGCRETTNNEINGILVGVRDAGSLATAMIRLVNEPELREAMGQRSRMIAEEKYSVKSVNAALLQIMSLPSDNRKDF